MNLTMKTILSCLSVMGRVTGLVLALNFVANIQPAMAGVIQLMEENDGGGDLVFVKDDMDEDDDNDSLGALTGQANNDYSTGL